MSEKELSRIADALERLAPAKLSAPDFSPDAFQWQAEPQALIPVPVVSRLPIELLLGVDRARDVLMQNTAQFAKGLPANNALLWGARGMGKSSLVKAVHGATDGVKLIELAREDLGSLPDLLRLLAASEHRFVLPNIHSDRHTRLWLQRALLDAFPSQD